MYFLKKPVYRWLSRLLGITPNDMEMVQYWKTREMVQAKLTRSKDGSMTMELEGEKYPFPGFPRGHLLFGSLSKLKHEIKNRLFNESWRKLEEGISKEEVIRDFKRALAGLLKLSELARYDMIPPNRMVSPVREIWRAWTVVEEKQSGWRKEFLGDLKKILTYILSEDDAYRFRVQWLVQIFNPSAWWFKLLFRDPVKDFELALTELEHAEIIGDMKERIRLLRRILLLILEDPVIKSLFGEFCREMNWNKLKLSEADKFHFRGKWFRVDLVRFEY